MSDCLKSEPGPGSCPGPDWSCGPVRHCFDCAAGSRLQRSHQIFMLSSGLNQTLVAAAAADARMFKAQVM